MRIVLLLHQFYEAEILISNFSIGENAKIQNDCSNYQT